MWSGHRRGKVSSLPFSCVFINPHRKLICSSCCSLLGLGCGRDGEGALALEGQARPFYQRKARLIEAFRVTSGALVIAASGGDGHSRGTIKSRAGEVFWLGASSFCGEFFPLPQCWFFFQCSKGGTSLQHCGVFSRFLCQSLFVLKPKRVVLSKSPSVATAAGAAAPPSPLTVGRLLLIHAPMRGLTEAAALY